MAAVVLDPMEFAHQLEGAGFTRQQAEAVAKGYTAMLVHNFDALVTKDYLDTRFTEFETRVELSMDRRFREMEAEIDRRFSGMDARFTGIDKRFAGIDKRFAEMDQGFAGMDVRFERLEGKFRLVFWMLGLTIACVVVPVIRDFL